jgi:F-type H+-transporting ATPase subunit b
MFSRVIAWFAAVAALAALGPVAAAAQAAEGHGDVSLNPVSPEAIQADLAIWTAVVFLAVLAILWVFAWGPITRFLQRREEGIADQIRQAEESNQQAKQVLAEYEQKLAESQGEVRQILEQARRDAEEAGRQIVEKARADAEATAQRARQEIESATSSALEEIAQQGASMAVELAGKIVRAKLDPRDHSQLIEQAMAKFPKGKAGEN